MTLEILLEEFACNEEEEAMASPIGGSSICRWQCECCSMIVCLRERRMENLVLTVGLRLGIVTTLAMML